MKKILLGIVSLVAVIAGLLLIWNFIIPFIGNVFSGFGSIFSGLTG